jgi:hypothetical protein
MSVLFTQEEKMRNALLESVSADLLQELKRIGNEHFLQPRVADFYAEREKIKKLLESPITPDTSRAFVEYAACAIRKAELFSEKLDAYHLGLVHCDIHSAWSQAFSENEFGVANFMTNLAMAVESFLTKKFPNDWQKQLNAAHESSDPA